MADADKGMRIDTMAVLCQMSTAEFLEQVVRQPHISGFLPGDTSSRHHMRWGHGDALTIEVARQLHDDSGVPFADAIRLCMYALRLPIYFEAATSPAVASKTVSDFWIAVSASRNTWGSSPRGSWPVTSFGPGEYWAQNHFAGAFDDVVHEIKKWMLMDEVMHSDSDPARIFLCNVSTADRRLQKRAADLGIDLGVPPRPA